MAVLAVPDKGRRVNRIATGEIVTVIGRPHADDIGLVDIIWKDKHYLVFLVDLEQRI